MANFNDSEILRELLLVPKPFQLDFFLTNNERIQDDSTYWLIVATLWIDNGTTVRVNDFIRLFQSPRRNRNRLMKKRDRRTFGALPAIVTAYRAVAPDEDHRRIFAWSLDLATLKRLYPRRHIIQNHFSKDRVLAYFDRRGEREIIVLPESALLPPAGGE